MTVRTLEYTGTLTITACPTCSIAHAVPRDLYRHAQDDHSVNVYCPLGHSWVFIGETEAKRLARELQWAEDRNAAERARADGAEASLRTTKGHVTRLRKQVLAGECPLCGQHLRDLARHISRQHPDEPVEDPTR